ncbi:MAG TPA: YceH family protein [Acidimicrobiales bacterium]|nr:YceH family protein [Acidimicrobiales bacterium]
MAVDLELTPVQARVVGSLVEKQLATPQQYPLTLNSLVLACNQTTNREPVTSYGEREVDDVLGGLKDIGLVRFVHPSHGGRVTKYRQVLEERLDLSVEELAVLCVMLLRGPQTVNELRARTERLASFSSSDEVESVLAALAARPEPLVVRFERQPGMREPRWMHLLSGEPVDVPVVAASSPPASRGRNDDRLAALEDEVQRLRAEFDAFRASFE